MAQKMFVVGGECDRGCGRTARHRHHKDENTHNNTAENIEFLCPSCHSAHHNAQRAAGPECINCGAPRNDHHRRCGRCRGYRNRHGVERPLEAVASQ
jgi:hypothetical protein